MFMLEPVTNYSALDNTHSDILALNTNLEMETWTDESGWRLLFPDRH